MWGPEGSFIEDNNSLALATIMTVPLIRYLQLQTTKRELANSVVSDQTSPEGPLASLTKEDLEWLLD